MDRKELSAVCTVVPKLIDAIRGKMDAQGVDHLDMAFVVMGSPDDEIAVAPIPRSKLAEIFDAEHDAAASRLLASPPKGQAIVCLVDRVLNGKRHPLLTVPVKLAAKGTHGLN